MESQVSKRESWDLKLSLLTQNKYAFIWDLEPVKVKIDYKHDMAIDTVLKYVHVFLVFLFGAYEEWSFPLVACLIRNMVLLFCHARHCRSKVNRKKSLQSRVRLLLFYSAPGMLWDKLAHTLLGTNAIIKPAFFYFCFCVFTSKAFFCCPR